MAPRPKTSRFTRLVVLVWTVAGVLLLTGLIRGLTAIGMFTHAAPVTPGVCRAVPLQGPGDLVADGKSRTLFIAASDRRTTGNKADGLYYLTLDGARPVKLAGGPADFHPQSLSLSYGLDGALVLMVVDRKADGAAVIESFGVVFDGAVPKLSAQSAIRSGLVARPGGIAALGEARFYIANDPTKSDIIAWFNRYALLPRADILYFNSMMFREAVSGLSDPSAVALSPDGKHLFVASRNERRVIGFSLNPISGDLTELGALDLPMRPEHMTVDGGSLWVAGAQKLPAFGGLRQRPDETFALASGAGDGGRQRQAAKLPVGLCR